MLKNNILSLTKPPPCWNRGNGSSLKNTA